MKTLHLVAGIAALTLISTTAMADIQQVGTSAQNAVVNGVSSVGKGIGWTYNAVAVGVYDAGAYTAYGLETAGNFLKSGFGWAVRGNPNTIASHPNN